MAGVLNGTILLTEDALKLTFGWTDYLLFGGLIGISLVVGFYFGIFSKQDSANEYLYGGKHMDYFPVAVSILASLLSGITFLGVPTEVYFHGAGVVVCFLPIIVCCSIQAYIFIPIFYDLRLSNSYEYLELRFSKTIRTFASTMYVISLLLYIPIVVYVPSLAFAQATGWGVHLISAGFSLICITYTTMGGVKAVVWTDTIQFVFTVIGVFTILILGIKTVGGLPEAFKIADEGKRLDWLDLNPSLLSRNTSWALSFGSLFMYMSRITVGQKFIQRYLAIEKEVNIKKAIFLQAVGWIIMMIVCILIGLLVYAKYHGCDPLSAKLVHQNDQTIPYYVMDIARNLHGLPGLFLAGLVSSALSTMSASLNTMSGIIYLDFVDRWIPNSPKKDTQSATIMKIISVIIGFVVIATIFIIERLGTIFEMANSLSSIVDSPLLGCFILGVFFPRAGKKGVMFGMLASMAITSWILAGIQWNTYKKRLPNPSLPLSIEDCPYPLNETIISTQKPLLPEEQPMMLYRISFLYLIMIGTLICVVCGLTVSVLLGESDPSDVDPRHICPGLRRFLPKKKYTEVPLKEAPMEKINR